MLGEFLYQLTTKDAITAPVLQRVIQRGGDTQALATVPVVLPVVPHEMMFVVRNLSLIGIAGAAQTVSRLEWNILADGANDLGAIGVSTPNPAVATWGFSEFKEFILMPGESLRARGFFNAGAAANTISATAIGMFLPKGTMQFR